MGSEGIAPVMWAIRPRMSDAGFRYGTHLHERLVELMGDDAPSYQHFTRVMRDPPVRLSMSLLAALCEALSCEPGELLIRPLPGPPRRPGDRDALLLRGLGAASSVVGRPLRNLDGGLSVLTRRLQDLSPLTLDVALHVASGEGEAWESIPPEDLQAGWAAFTDVWHPTEGGVETPTT